MYKISCFLSKQHLGAQIQFELKHNNWFLLSGQKVSHFYKWGKALKTKTKSLQIKVIISQVKSIFSHKLFTKTNKLLLSHYILDHNLLSLFFIIISNMY